jgi:hypothetical protein
MLFLFSIFLQFLEKSQQKSTFELKRQRLTQKVNFCIKPHKNIFFAYFSWHNYHFHFFLAYFLFSFNYQLLFCFFITKKSLFFLHKFNLAQSQSISNTKIISSLTIQKYFHFVHYLIFTISNLFVIFSIFHRKQKSPKTCTTSLLPHSYPKNALECSNFHHLITPKMSTCTTKVQKYHKP